MNAFIAVIPIFLVRYVLLGIVNREALPRAAFTPPPAAREIPAFWIYQLSNLAMLLYLLALRIRSDFRWFRAGLTVYGLGIALYAASAMDYGRPKPNGINVTGLYRVSRNPMYVAYFICLAGCVLLTGSTVLLVLLIIFQISVHWVILSEERWCIRQFGDEYATYMKKVRRYV